MSQCEIKGETRCLRISSLNNWVDNSFPGLLIPAPFIAISVLEPLPHYLDLLLLHGLFCPRSFITVLSQNLSFQKVLLAN